MPWDQINEEKMKVWLNSVVFSNKINFMMNDIGMQECDSFDDEDIDDLQAELQHLEGPSLEDFNIKQESPIVSLTSKIMIKSILDQQGRDLRLIGNDRQAQFQSFFYVLLLIGVEERRNYPHLNTLIRQQFYKPNIFRPSDQLRAEVALAAEMLQKSLKYFQQIGQGIRLEDYIIKQPIFEEAGILMIKNSIELQDQRSIYQQLAAKFNIDLKIIKQDDQGQHYQFGANKRYQIIREGEYYFVGTTQSKDQLGHSRYEIESVRSGESGLQFAQQVSQQSTPKFKNSEVKFHKKSHKNSFGGDLEIVQYRDLLQIRNQKMSNMPKVLSQYMDLNEVESCAQNMIDTGPKAHTFEDIIKTEVDQNVIKMDMKGSTTIQPTHLNYLQRRKDRKISSSEIIECRDFGNRLMRHQSLPQVEHEPQEEQADKGNSYSSLVVVKDEPLKMRTSIIKNKQLQRIQQLQSSQKESTHPDQESQHSDFQAEPPPVPLSENQIQVKLKDRKYSYFTQQMASTKSKKQKEIESSNYVFKLPKNNHKNSEVIITEGLEEEYIKRRFEENPLRFSQLGPSQDSVHQCPSIQRKLNDKALKLSSTVYSYMVKFQPQDWYKKEIIYYKNNHQKEIFVFQRSFQSHPPQIPSIQPQRLLPCYQPCQYSYSEHNLKPHMRDSFGSSNSFWSNIKSQPSLTTKDQRQTVHAYNPYEINQSSFLKNRIQSMSQLQPYKPREDRSEDSKSIVFPSCKSMKSIRLSPDKSPTKISFNYYPSVSALRSPGSPSPCEYRPRNLPYNYTPGPPIPTPRSTQFPQVLPRTPQPNRPQTYNNISTSSFQNRFFRASGR